MKEDHAVAGILIMLISALVLGAFAQANPGGITGGATFFPQLVGAETAFGKAVIWIVAIIAVVAGSYALYNLYFRNRAVTTRFSETTRPSFKPDSLGVDFSHKEKSDLNRVKEYVFRQRAKGRSDIDIRDSLESVGWDPALLSKAFK